MEKGKSIRYEKPRMETYCIAEKVATGLTWGGDIGEGCDSLFDA